MAPEPEPKESNVEEELRAIFDNLTDNTALQTAEALRPMSRIWLSVKDMMVEEGWPENVALEVVADALMANMQAMINNSFER